MLYSVSNHPRPLTWTAWFEGLTQGGNEFLLRSNDVLLVVVSTISGFVKIYYRALEKKMRIRIAAAVFWFFEACVCDSETVRICIFVTSMLYLCSTSSQQRSHASI